MLSQPIESDLMTKKSFPALGKQYVPSADIVNMTTSLLKSPAATRNHKRYCDLLKYKGKASSLKNCTPAVQNLIQCTSPYQHSSRPISRLFSPFFQLSLAQKNYSHAHLLQVRRVYHTRRATSLLRNLSSYIPISIIYSDTNTVLLYHGSNALMSLKSQTACSRWTTKLPTALEAIHT